MPILLTQEERIIGVIKNTNTGRNNTREKRVPLKIFQPALRILKARAASQTKPPPSAKTREISRLTKTIATTFIISNRRPSGKCRLVSFDLGEQLSGVTTAAGAIAE